jgi:ribosome biogenesis GTPase
MDLRILGWNAFFEEGFGKYRDAGFIQARIVARQANLFTALSEAGEMRGKVSGRMRYECAESGDFPAVGDWVAVKGNPETGVMTIHAVLPRKTKFMRAEYDRDAYQGDQVVCANLDVLFIVLALDQEFNVKSLERYTAQASVSGSKAVVILNKSDLCGNFEQVLAQARSVARDIPIIATSAKTGQGLEEIGKYLAEGITGSLVGPSGAGKSTIINALLGEERMTTAEVRDYDSKGRQTTTHRELVILPGRGMLIDNPGMRGLGITGDQGLVASAFEDVEALIGRCKFSDCQHRTEPGCAIKEALADGTLSEDRYESYKHFLRELWVISVKKSQRTKLGKDVSKAIKRRQKFEKERYS